MKWNEGLGKEWEDIAFFSLFLDTKIYSWGQGEQKIMGGKLQLNKELIYN